MAGRRIHVIQGLFLATLAAGASGLYAQTPTTGTIVGTVTDATRAVVPGAEIELLALGTNRSRAGKSNEVGRYTFPNVTPGEYKITVTVPGFRIAALTVSVEVARTTLADVILEVGATTETVEVTAGARATLQTTDASLGDVIGGDDILRLPTTQRNALELLYLQEATVPAIGLSGQHYGRAGGVAGARGDQNTVTIDGVDATEMFTSLFRGVSSIDLPVDAVEEFRSTTVNPNAHLGSASSGGNFSFKTRSGTNAFHSATYWYHQNADLNANTWTRNKLGQEKPELRDNRFGGRLGGPIRRNNTFFFGFYERRRFPQSKDAVRLVPSDTLRQGILRFRDATGNIVSYNLNPGNGPISTLCDSPSSSCDPRELGMNPLIKQYFESFPRGNDPSSGDGLNTVGFRAPADVSLDQDTALFRLDHNFTSNWRAAGSYTYQRLRVGQELQLEMDTAITGGKGFKTLRGTPRDPRHMVLELTGQITPNITNDFRVGWNRQDFGTTGSLPRTQLPEVGVPIRLAGDFLDDLGDPRFDRARPQFTRQRNWSFIDNLTWLRGRHMMQFSFSSARRTFFNSRPDRTSVNTVPTAEIRGGQSVTIPTSERPPTCSAAAPSNCLISAEVSRWNALYGGLLGLWDNTSIIAIRDAQGNLTGDLFTSGDFLSWHHEIRASDTWSVTPSLTLSYGLNFLIETPWTEKRGRSFLLVNADTGELFQPRELLARKWEAAAQGKVFNFPFAYAPPDLLGRKAAYDTNVEVGPRASAAWNPSFTNGILGRLFGDRDTVFRGGYSLLYDRLLASFFLTTQFASNEFLASTATIAAPTCNVAGTPGPGCTGSALPPFRIGVDGQPFAPEAAPSISLPLVPAERRLGTTAFPVSGARGIDPELKLGRAHTANFTLQRELPGDVVLELGWIGRWGRRLPARANTNAVPVNLVDLTGRSSQTFAQAFDAVATQLRSGAPPSSVTPQPWFENIFGAGQTGVIAAGAATQFQNGRVDQLFQTVTFPGGLRGLDQLLISRGFQPVLNQQFDNIMWLTNGNWSNYNAFFTTVRKRFSHGLSLTANWTLSHWTDTGVEVADAGVGVWTDPFRPEFDLGDSLSDIRHVVKVFGTYELPLPRTNKWLDGWYISPIFVARTGVPLLVNQVTQIFGTPFNNVSAPTIDGGSISGRVRSGVPGSGGVGTAGDPARGGTGLNLFDDPEAVFRNFRPFLISEDDRSERGAVRGLGFWNLDLSVGKRTEIKDGLRIAFSFDFFNVLNHPSFNDPSSLSILTPASFGVISSQNEGQPARADSAGPRRIQFGLRVEF